MLSKTLFIAALAAASAGSDCEKLTSQSLCASNDCSWCSSGAVGESCNSKEDAAALPSSIFTCDNLGNYTFLASTDCDKINSQSDCASASCVWCESGAVGASCNTKEDAAALPASIFTCDNAQEVSYKFLASTDCDKINSQSDCASASCVWCESGAVGASCNTKEDAAALPASIFTCDDSKVSARLKPAVPVQNEYYFMSSGNCDSITDQKTCDSASCVWCESGAVGASCNSKEDAAALPASIFTCDDSIKAKIKEVAPEEVMIKHGDNAAIRANPVKPVQYNHTLGNLGDYQNDPLGYTTLYHSEVAYCGSDVGLPSYMDRDYNTNQYTETFEPAAYIHSDNSKQSIRGYVGVQPNVKAIIVSFRGSEDLNNWITNLDAVRVTYDKCDGCSVHSGFYSATQSVYSQVYDAVSNLASKYPGYKIAVTGHSLGAALATLTALELIDSFGSKVVVYNYGCPRLFNGDGANWASSGVVNIAARRTHYKDIVPHAPPYLSGYRHTVGEIYEGGPSSDYPNFPGGPLQVCEGEESDKCADQWDIGSISDHLLYSGVHMGTGGCEYL